MSSVQVLVVLSFAMLTGACSSVTPARTPVPPEVSVAFQVAKAAPCAPEDPHLRELAARISAVRGREGFYARADLEAAAKDRDALIAGVLARHLAIARCMPPGAQREGALAISGVLMACLLEGLDPEDCSHEVYVIDLRRPPQAMPFAARACDGTGFEGAAQCLVLVGPAALVDVISLPLGTWFWAGPDVEETLYLRTFPPPAPLRAQVRQALARR